MEKQSFFYAHAKSIGFLVTVIILAGGVIAGEIVLSQFMGLGNPVLYDSSPWYGYRPLPNQRLVRFGGSTIVINNLGLRADQDWDANIQDKVLFLGDSVTYGGSYVSNSQLFSTLAVKSVPGLKDGNAGVNAWGVENIHGLVVRKRFQPAKTYVTVLIEGDFYRGLQRISGMPFWCVKPRFAWQELIFYVANNLNGRRYRNWEEFSTPAERQAVVEFAVSKLKEMEVVLTAKGYHHLLFISPGRDHVESGKKFDAVVETALQQAALSPIYLKDEIDWSGVNFNEVYYDGAHLNPKGHELWGAAIGRRLLAIHKTGERP